MNYALAFRDPDAAAFIRERIEGLGRRLAGKGRPVALMEVCGSHTMAIARFGIRSMLPPVVNLVSGPGCPVCVTVPGYIDAAVAAARRGHIVASFGDMISVPGTRSSLAKTRAEGARIEVLYSPREALDLAEATPDREVVFLAIGFETTAPPVISLIRMAEERRIDNLSLLVAFKLVPPALDALVSDPDLTIDGFLCPPHVSSIIGSSAYRRFVERDAVACVVAGFEPLDILYGIQGLLEMIAENAPRLVNHYSRAVRPEGNVVAQRVLATYLEPEDAEWRGLGVIPASGLRLRPEYARYDAARKLSLTIPKGKTNGACRCGEILKGKLGPTDCPLFGRTCTPLHPVGPCMVSSEGSCAAFYKYVRIG